MIMLSAINLVTLKITSSESTVPLSKTNSRGRAVAEYCFVASV